MQTVDWLPPETRLTLIDAVNRTSNTLLDYSVRTLVNLTTFQHEKRTRASYSWELLLLESSVTCRKDTVVVLQ